MSLEQPSGAAPGARTIRMAELLGGLSLVLDAANGLRAGSSMRTAILAVTLAREAGASERDVRASYWTALLRLLGYSAAAPEVARYSAGRDRALRAQLLTVDRARPSTLLYAIARGTESISLAERAHALLRFAAAPDLCQQLADAHCAQADWLAASLGVSDAVRDALLDSNARYDGRGAAHGARGDELSWVARIVRAAGWATAHDEGRSMDALEDAITSARGTVLDPSLADRLARVARATLNRLRSELLEQLLEAEPEPRWQVDDLDRVYAVFGQYADLKSGFFLGHSTGVAALADRSAQALGFDDDERALVRHAALLHDVGRVAVSNHLWECPAPLGRLELDAMAAHASHTEQMLRFAEATRPLSAIAASAHERLDESGYPHRRAPRSRAARLLAACDVAHALGESRPHRPAMRLAEAERVLACEVQADRLDRHMVDAVRAVLRGQPLRSAPSVLSEREREVLVLLARGLASKEIAAELQISPKTVQHHIAHIYEKIGVRSRAAAALRAVELGLAPSFGASAPLFATARGGPA